MTTAEFKQKKKELDNLEIKMETRTATVEERAHAKALMKEMDKERRAIETVKTQQKHVARGLDVAKKAETVSFAVLMDCTGSMSRYIEAMKKHALAAVDEVKRRLTHGSVRIAFVGYRDFDDTDRFEVLQFSDDMCAFQNFVEKIKATGGADEAEDVAGGVAKVAELDWRPDLEGSTRVVLHFADAPAHGSRYHCESVNDSFATEDFDVATSLKRLRKLGVLYWFCRIRDSTDQMVKAFNAEVGQGSYINTIDAADANSVADHIISTLLTSVMNTVSVQHSMVVVQKCTPRHTGGRLASIEVMPEDKAWEEPRTLKKSPSFSDMGVFRDLAVQEALVMTTLNITSLHMLRQRWEAKHDIIQVEGAGGDSSPQEKVCVRIEGRPFAQGATRHAFEGQMKLHDRWDLFVMKRFKGNEHGLARYEDQIEASNVANFLATQYNAQAPAGCRKVEFLKSHVLIMMQDGRPCSRRYTVERALPVGSNFTKFCNNVGHWDPRLFDRSLARFCLFTYEATKGYLMVVDLQGVLHEDTYTLTDPAILCRDADRFVETNFGHEAMVRNLKTIEAILR